MKVAGICGSPRKGNSERMLRAVLDAAKGAGAETALFLGREHVIHLCDGTERQTLAGRSTDDMSALARSVTSADVIIFASPVYFDMISPQLLNILVRLNTIGNTLKKKKFAICLAGQIQGNEGEASLSRALEYVRHVGSIYEMEYLDAVLACGVGDTGDAEERDDILHRCEALGKKVAS